jgi:hypothetical protein
MMEAADRLVLPEVTTNWGEVVLTLLKGVAERDFGVVVLSVS